MFQAISLYVEIKSVKPSLMPTMLITNRNMVFPILFFSFNTYRFLDVQGFEQCRLRVV